MSEKRGAWAGGPQPPLQVNPAPGSFKATEEGSVERKRPWGRGRPGGLPARGTCPVSLTPPPAAAALAWMVLNLDPEARVQSLGPAVS